MTRPVVLCILDGWGLNPSPKGNAVAQASTPHFDRIMAECPTATLLTHGPDVGLPRGQMGNSEVGHTNIGAGRVVAMDLGQIDLAIEEGSFASNPALLEFAQKMRDTNGTAHVFGVVSDGGVHGHITHTKAAVTALAAAGVKVAVHAITDGRDVAPKSAGAFLADLQASLPDGARIATVIGRYWAMDRDNRWERVERAWRAITLAEGDKVANPAQAVEQAYARGETDEFIAPAVVSDYAGARSGDGVFCLNFRADRAREILAALGAPSFTGFNRGQPPQWAAMLGMVDYSTAHNAFMTTAYPKQQVKNGLGEWVAAHGLRQFRLAETEKYPHVTFFLNGGTETAADGEDRAMPASPKVATYDLQPEMSAGEVTSKLVAAIGAGYDLIVVNFANPDMVGHTGDLAAAMRACEAVDEGLGATLVALQQAGGAMLVCADHGNCETMIDLDTGGPHTAHTLNPVPVVLVGGPDSARLRDGRLADVAPTLLALMGLAQPPEMTGESLILS
ncbi:2,3-bisphosphoglycerate-independent phosphoglycerate mutase [Roseibaca ekhonensis]|uniref:2,3-bisphosphoglycerate-independent phosphoglycerate mutase n=1 Tax=Roseinatronobacter ekhonensis TaxID=254356 RepID=A0A3B0MV84_9RHOB|nr:2,3-bisphosphoglycerate-independent phosphoglycerate mutase [Roseibaca ekhonensis]SUZ31726.1 2,3-bisphosphoglycerate-independent phosphoglycerate mutase [Roseibaca ekhonensis]